MKSWCKRYCHRIFYLAYHVNRPLPTLDHRMQASRIHLMTTAGITKAVSHAPYVTSQLPSLFECHYSSVSGKSGAGNDNDVKLPPILPPCLPPAPTNCCMSGCANCVWLEYAEQLRKSLRCSSIENKEIILRQIDDPNMRAFLDLELTFMGNTCRYRPGAGEEVHEE